MADFNIAGGAADPPCGRDGRLCNKLAVWKPGVLLPECLERDVVAVENVPFGFAHVADADRKLSARAQSAFAVAGVLPEVPMIPWRGVARLKMIIRNP